MSIVVEVIVASCAPLVTAGVLGCFGHLRSINRRLSAMETRDFTQDLHILDLYQKLHDRSAA